MHGKENHQSLPVRISKDYCSEIQDYHSYHILDAASSGLPRMQTSSTLATLLWTSWMARSVQPAHPSSTRERCHPSNMKTMPFLTKASPLSNHYMCNFTVNGIMYNCIEQYLMAAKGDVTGWRHNLFWSILIMKAVNSGKQKVLGKKVAGFDLEEWRKVAPEILLRDTRKKFTQNSFC